MFLRDVGIGRRIRKLPRGNVNRSRKYIRVIEANLVIQLQKTEVNITDTIAFRVGIEFYFCKGLIGDDRCDGALGRDCRKMNGDREYAGDKNHTDRQYPDCQQHLGKRKTGIF